MSKDTFSGWTARAFENAIPDAKVDVVKGQNGQLVADISAVAVGQLRLLTLAAAQQSLCTYILDDQRLAVAFPTNSAARQVWQGTVLKLGDLIVLGPGGRIYQVMKGAGAWGWLTLPPTLLKYWCRVLSGDDSSNPMSGGVLRPQRSAFEWLVQTHLEALNVTNNSPEILASPEALRAIEHDLIHALVNCLTAPGTISESDSTARQRRRHSGLMLEFDGYLDTFPGQSLSISEIAEELDVSERTLRLICKRFAGLGPRHYSSLRRMNAARTALLEASPQAESVSGVAEMFGFRSAGRFAASYRQLFGENPLKTLRGAANMTLRQSMAENE